MNHKTIRRLEEFSFVLPALIMFMIFVAYPFLQGIPMSFTNWDGMSATRIFVGLKNYPMLFQDKNFVNATKNTLLFTILAMVFSNILGLLFAVMISKASKLNSLLRTCIFMPYCLSLVLSSYIWRYVYSDVFYDKFGIPSPLGSMTCRHFMSPFYPAEMIVARGYACAAFRTQEIAPDYEEGFTTGFHRLFPEYVKNRPKNA